MLILCMYRSDKDFPQSINFVLRTKKKSYNILKIGLVLGDTPDI